MNAIQQISLKLQMGIHPAADIRPEMLRAMWCELSRERYHALRAAAAGPGSAAVALPSANAILLKKGS
jgi:hypothetical protein